MTMLRRKECEENVVVGRKKGGQHFSEKGEGWELSQQPSTSRQRASRVLGQRLHEPVVISSVLRLFHFFSQPRAQRAGIAGRLSPRSSENNRQATDDHARDSDERQPRRQATEMAADPSGSSQAPSRLKDRV
jgi:hypothetical protein